MPSRRKPTPAAERKRRRIGLRFQAFVQVLIQRAMAVTGLTAGGLADGEASPVPDEHGRMVLSGADREAFLAAVTAPPEPSESLVVALRRYRDLIR